MEAADFSQQGKGIIKLGHLIMQFSSVWSTWTPVPLDIIFAPAPGYCHSKAWILYSGSFCRPVCENQHSSEDPILLELIIKSLFV